MSIELTKLRVINWHFMTDTGVLPLKLRTFFTGRNASGKSTIIDALITLLFVNKSGYNKANDISSGRGEGRTLMGYIRGARTVSKGENDAGEQTKEYMRMGSTVTHITTELVDTKRNVFYTLGVTFEVAAGRSESSAINSKWWLAKDVHLEEIPLTAVNHEGKTMVQSLDKIKSQLPEEWFNESSLRFTVYAKDAEAKMALSSLLGISAKKHGSKDDMDFWKKTMMRCVAFKPESSDMKNSDAFVRNIVLEPGNIDETDLEELLAQLQDACNALSAIQDRHQALKQILELGSQYGAAARHHRKLENTICLIRMLALEESVAALDAECNVLAEEHKDKEDVCQRIRDELLVLRDEKKELEMDPSIREATPLSREIEEREKEIKAYEASVAQFLTNLEKVKDVAAKVNNVFGTKVLNDNRVDRAIAIAGEMLDLSELRDLVTELAAAEDKVRQLLADLKQEKDAADARIGELREEIAALKKGRVRPEPYAQKLKDVITHSFRAKGISGEPKYLYELLDYKDSSWAYAAEAHIGRKALFSLIVAPENYRVAAKAFRDCEDKQGVAGAILVNTRAFATEDIEIVEGSLAANLTTKNPFVRQYINYRYNQVMLVEDATEHKDVAGTCLDIDGMRYSAYNLTRLKLPQHTMIGERARQEQLASAEAELAALELRSEELRGLNHYARLANDAFKANSIIDLRSTTAAEQLRQAHQLPIMKKSLAEKRAQYQQMTSSEPFYRLCKIDKVIKAKQAEEEEAVKAERTAVKALSDKEAEHDKYHKALIDAEDMFNDLEKVEPDAALEARKYLEEQKSAYPKRYLPRHEMEMAADMKATKQKMDDFNSTIQLEQKAYNRSIGANFLCTGFTSMEIFEKAYERLDSEELPIAQRNSELYNKQMSDLLQSRLLSGLKTGINNARNALRVLNKTLESMVYNGKYYQFAKIKPAKGKERFYDVILRSDSADIGMQTLNLFNTHSEEDLAEEEQVIRELVENLRMPKSTKGENWLDYRTYCEFAIDVVSAENAEHRIKLDNSVATFSGAEVQIPFYMILTASLVNRYAQGARLTPETIRNSNALRLMIVDECFSKMDTGNTQQLVEFICRDMGMQLIAAAPPATFTTLAGAVNDVIYVKEERRGNRVYRACFPFTAEEFLMSDEYEETWGETEEGSAE